MQRFFVEPDNVVDGKIVIRGNDVNHMKRVLRMKVGEQVEVCDSGGFTYLCCIEDYVEGESTINKNKVKNTGSEVEKEKDKKSAKQELVAVLRIEKKWLNDTELSSEIYLFQGLPKSDKMELIIQKAVELGVHEIIPVMSNRVVVKLDDKKSLKKVSRWNAISESAAKQSGRGIIPKVRDVMSFMEGLEFSKEMDVVLFPYELAEDMNKTKGILQGIQAGQKIGVFIGPEGGFEKEEVEKAMGAGAFPITLGKRILRTETAAIAALLMLGYELG